MNGRVDEGERPPWPRLGLRSLSRTQHSQAQPLAMATRMPLPQCSAEAFPGRQHKRVTAHTQRHTAPTPHASRDPAHYDKRPVTARCPVTPQASHCPVSLCQPPRLSLSSVLSHPQLCGIPPVTPRACAGPPVTARAFTTQHHLLSPPGPVVALPTALGPSPPDVLSPPRPVTAWCPSCHPAGCHHPLSPPLSSQPGQDSLGEMQRALPCGARLPALQGQRRRGTSQRV